MSGPELNGQKLAGRTLGKMWRPQLIGFDSDKLLNFGTKCSPEPDIFSHILAKIHTRLSTGFIKMFVSCWLDGEKNLDYADWMDYAD
jgi:hypothetical protein